MPQGRIVCALALKSIRFRKVLRAFRPESSHAGSQSLIFQSFCTLAYCIAAWAETIASFKEFTLRYNRRLVLQCGLLRSLSAPILSANLRAIPLRMRYFIFPKSRAASLTARKKMTAYSLKKTPPQLQYSSGRICRMLPQQYHKYCRVGSQSLDCLSF